MNRQATAECKRELKVVWEMFKNDPLSPFTAYCRRYVVTGMGMFTEGYTICEFLSPAIMCSILFPLLRRQFSTGASFAPVVKLRYALAVNGLKWCALPLLSFSADPLHGNVRAQPAGASAICRTPGKSPRTPRPAAQAPIQNKEASFMAHMARSV